MNRVWVRVEGKVQGVFFRASTQRKCHEWNLVGWVKNNKDGSVEVEAEGLENQLLNLLKWLQTGPPNAKVVKLTTKWKKPEQKEDGFKIKKGLP